MKKVFFFAVFTTAFTFLSFSKVSTQPNGKYNSFGDVYTYNGSFPVSFDGVQFYNECTNQTMTLSGSVYFKYHGVYKGSRSAFDALHINVRGIKAVDERGRQYQISGTNNIHSTYSFVNGVYSERGIQNERWTTAGGQNNFTISYTYNISFDAYGNVTVKRDESEVHCQ